MGCREGRSRRLERGHGGRVDGGLGWEWPGPEAPTFQTAAAQMPSQLRPGPSNPLTSFPALPPLQAPLCLPRRLKALAASSSGERKNRTQPKGEEKPGTLPGQAELGELMCSLCPRPLWASVSPPQTCGQEMEGSMTGKQVGVGKNQGRSLKPSPGFLRTGGVSLRSQDGAEQEVSLFSIRGSFLKAGGGGQCLCSMQPSSLLLVGSGISHCLPSLRPLSVTFPWILAPGCSLPWACLFFFLTFSFLNKIFFFKYFGLTT